MEISKSALSKMMPCKGSLTIWLWRPAISDRANIDIFKLHHCFSFMNTFLNEIFRNGIKIDLCSSCPPMGCTILYRKPILCDTSFSSDHTWGLRHRLATQAARVWIPVSYHMIFYLLALNTSVSFQFRG